MRIVAPTSASDLARQLGEFIDSYVFRLSAHAWGKMSINRLFSAYGERYHKLDFENQHKGAEKQCAKNFYVEKHMVFSLFSILVFIYIRNTVKLMFFCFKASLLVKPIVFQHFGAKT